ncbi:hypothetical protein O181_002611 [Austropuccinia psidii MF-1]|uniref:U4/U6.U5 tri-snRNP-associated protein 1 n=1 Tax=Austropuccinia psidii MF-1 TaxID=1389203 RepID=A0A9Q3GDE7_9BASI|nr:hypothetical protein [Austropuccinia psidii MF-1]
MSQTKESLSIEETNKIRLSLGLKPLPTNDTDNSANQLDPDQKAKQNYEEYRKKEAEDLQSKKTQDRILKAKENRERLAKLNGRGLGDLAPDEVDQDLKKWVKQHKNKQSRKINLTQLAQQKEAKLNAEEVDYSAKDLQGLKVGHDLEELQSTLMDQEMVLTLKDSRILDGQDDELENVELAEKTKTKEAVELKRLGKQAGQYTGYDDDEFLNPGQSKTILAKYSDTLDGKQDKSFQLGTELQLDDTSANLNKVDNKEITSKISKKDTAEILKQNLLSLEYSKVVGSDYIQEGDPEFKKKNKKSKSKSKRRQPNSTLSIEANPDEKPFDAMEIDPPNIQPTVQADVIDDEEVQAAMSRMRREVGKLRRKRQQANSNQAKDAMDIDSRPVIESDLPRNLAEEDDEDEDDGRLVIDDTSEFIRTISLQQQRAAELRKKEEQANRMKAKSTARESSLSAIPEDGADSIVDDEEERRTMERLMAGDRETVPVKNEVGELNELEDPIVHGATGSEKYVRGGMASTLALLKSQGLIKSLTPEEREKERLYVEKTHWLIEQRRREALREAEKDRAKKMGDAKDQATREYENRIREAALAKEAMEAYRHYKPDVEIKYNDEFGRELTQKEAWKALSHKFHGKGSGKAKTEKRIKKIEEEKKLAAMASGDTPTGTNEAFRKRQEKLGSATMVLSVGNKGSAPHQEEFLSSLSKPSGSTSKKSKSNANKEMMGANALHRSNRHTISAGPDLMNGLGSQLNSGISSSMEGFQTPSGLMAPRKAGFKPIAVSQSKSGLLNNVLEKSVANAKSKISIGLSAKRKAEELPEGSPDIKRVS